MGSGRIKGIPARWSWQLAGDVSQVTGFLADVRMDNFRPGGAELLITPLCIPGFRGPGSWLDRVWCPFSIALYRIDFYTLQLGILIICCMLK